MSRWDLVIENNLPDYSSSDPSKSFFFFVVFFRWWIFASVKENWEMWKKWSPWNSTTSYTFISILWYLVRSSAIIFALNDRNDSNYCYGWTQWVPDQTSVAYAMGGQRCWIKIATIKKNGKTYLTYHWHWQLICRTVALWTIPI